MNPNPYESSVVPNLAVRETAGEDTSDFIKEWERYRLWFNAILVIESLLIALLQPPLVREPRFWLFAIEGAIIANICFCVGPVAHWYLTRLGMPRRITALIVFWVGTVLAMLLTLLAIVHFLHPSPF
jgi:hypothetical protein